MIHEKREGNMLTFDESEVQQAEAVPRPVSHCWLGRRNQQGAEKQPSGQMVPGKAAQKLAASNVWFCSVDKCDVCYLQLNEITPCTVGSAD